MSVNMDYIMAQISELKTERENDRRDYQNDKKNTDEQIQKMKSEMKIDNLENRYDAKMMVNDNITHMTSTSIFVTIGTVVAGALLMPIPVIGVPLGLGVIAGSGITGATTIGINESKKLKFTDDDKVIAAMRDSPGATFEDVKDAQRQLKHFFDTTEFPQQTDSDISCESHWKDQCEHLVPKFYMVNGHKVFTRLLR